MSIIETHGDSCRVDDDCSPLFTGDGRELSYTCRSGKCACATGFEIREETLVDADSRTGKVEVKNMKFCFRSGVGSNFNVGNDGYCVINAFYAATNDAVQVCGSNYGCFLCPEDYVATDGYGYCKRTKNDPPPVQAGTANLQPFYLSTLIFSFTFFILN